MGTLPRPEAAELAPGLLEWLRLEFGEPELDWAEPPVHLADGVTARVFSLQLTTTDERLRGPLVCRVYCDGGETLPADLVRVEAALQNALVAAGFPAPRVVACGDATTPVGAPILVMERVPGRDAFALTMRALALAAALAIVGPNWLLPGVLLGVWLAMARLLMRLHAVPGNAVAESLVSAGVPAERLGLGQILDDLERVADDVEEPGLTRALAWLNEHRPPPSDPPTVCHGDFWLANVMVSRRGLTLIDWTQSALTHRELDLGWMSVQHYSRMPLQIPDPLYDWLWLPVRPFTWLLLAPQRLLYLLARPVDAELLRYYTVLYATKILLHGQRLDRIWADGGGPRPAELSAWGSRHTRAFLRRQIRRITGFDPRS